MALDATIAAILCTVLLLLLIATLLTRRRTDQLNLPHPRGWPIVGNALQLASNGRADQQMERWARQYNGMFSIKIFNATWVILSNYDEIHEAFLKKSKVFSGRHRWFRFSWMVFGSKDIIVGDSNHPTWLAMRKSIHRVIQLHGSKLERVETVLVSSAQDFVQKVKSHGGQPVDLRQDIYDFVITVTLSIITGKNPNDIEDDDLFADCKTFDRMLTQLTGSICGVELDYYPWLRHFGHPTWKKLQDFAKLRDSLYDRLSRAGQDGYSADQAPPSIIHAIMQMLDQDSAFYEPTMTQEHAVGLIFDLIAAGISTTNNSSYALINLLIHYPHVYKKLQEEADRVIGHSRTPNILDRDAMPYTVATINELLRYISLAPVLVPRVTLEDTSVGKNKLPAGTIVIGLACYVHRDEKFWGDPMAFRPERFLDDNGKVLPPKHPNRKHLIPFGLGSRECVGEVFALRRLFVLVTSLVQAFDLEPGDVMVSCDPADYIDGGVLAQKPYTARLIARNIRS